MISRTTAEQAAAVLCLGSTVDTVTAEEVSGAFKAMARGAHPDAGGTAEAFAAIDRAKRALLEWIGQRGTAKAGALGQDCPRCAGAGHLRVQRGFTAMRVQCPNCQGSGELATERTKGTDE